MEKNRASFSHYVITAAPIALALWNSATTFAARNKINPYAHFGWINEQIGISSILLVAGITLMFVIQRRFGRRDYAASFISAELGLATICLTIFSRYFWVSLSLIALLALFDAAYLSLQLSSASPRRDKGIFIALSLMFITTLFFVSLSLFGAGN